MIIIIVVYCRTMLRNVVLVKLQSIVFDYFGFVNFWSKLLRSLFTGCNLVFRRWENIHPWKAVPNFVMNFCLMTSI